VSVTQFLIFAIIAAAVTVPSVILIPRARKSPLFDIVLWGATWLLAFLGEASAPTYFPSDSPLFSQWLVDQTPIIPTLIGALVGALSINVVLWLMDRFSPPPVEDEPTPNEEPNVEPGSSESIEKQ
jgi:hypothetical protein